MFLLKSDLNKKTISFVVCFLCSLLLFTLSFFICHVFSRRLPSAVEIANEQGLNISYKMATELFNTDSFIGAALSTHTTFIHSSTSYTASLVASTPIYGQLLGFEYLDGGYFLSNNASYAVVPEKLALQMFNTAQIIGNEIVINNKYYTICGVYKSRTGFLDRISAEAENRIFVSSAGDNEQVTHLLIASEAGANAFQLKAQAELSAGKSFFESGHDLRAPISFAKFVIYAAFLFILSLPLYWAIKLACTKACALITAQQPAKKYVLQICISALLIISVCSVLLFAIANINIAQIYLPADNIFDFEFYRGLIINFFVSANTIKAPMNFYPVIKTYCLAILTFSLLAAIFARRALRLLCEIYHLCFNKELLS